MTIGPTPSTLDSDVAKPGEMRGLRFAPKPWYHPARYHPRGVKRASPFAGNDV